MKQKKTRYDAGDFLLLEEYLAQQHSSGQAFLRSGFGGRLQFRTEAPAEYTYRLEFVSPGSGRQEFLQQAQAAGWTDCGRIYGWQCLRKEGVHSGEAEEASGLFHSTLERAKRGRTGAEREILSAAVPLMALYLASAYLKDASFAGILWRLTVLSLIVAIAVVFPAYRVRGKCGQILDQCRK